MDWATWAARSDTTKVFLVETAAVRLSDGLVVPLYLSNLPYQTPGKQFVPCVSGLPRLTRQANDTLSPNHIPTWGELAILLEPDCRPDADCSLPWTELLSDDWNLRGQPLTIKLGDPSFAYADFRSIFSGGVGKYNWTDALLTLTIYDKGQDLTWKLPDYELPFSPRVDSASWNQTVAAVLGKVNNFAPRLISSAHPDPYRYQFALACHVIQNVEVVYQHNDNISIGDPHFQFVQRDLFPASKDGDGAAVMDVVGPYTGANFAAEWLIQIDSVSAGTAVGQATFRWSMDKGVTWLGAGLLTAATPIPLADGVAVQFLSKAAATAEGIDAQFLLATDDFALADEWRFILGSSLGVVPEYSNGPITADVQGLISPVLGTYTELLGELIRAVLVLWRQWDAAADFDLEALAAFNTAFPYQVGLLVDSPTDIASIIDQLLSGIPALYTINQAGKFFITALAPITAAPDAAVELTDVEFLDLPAVADGSDNLYRRVYLNYDRNPNAVQNPTSTTANQARLEWLTQEFRSVSARDENLWLLYPWATDLGPLNTALVQRLEAQAVAAQNLALYRVKHPLYTVKTKIQPFQMDLWTKVLVRHDRFGVAPRAFAITGLDLDLTAAEATLTLWR